MGLDIYVGTFTRYYSGRWETVVQQFGREQGIPTKIIRAHDLPDALKDPQVIAPVILQWRELLNRSLTAAGFGPVDWDEGLGPPYFTDKPNGDCYHALRRLAAQADGIDMMQADQLLPAAVNEQMVEQWRRAGKSRFAHLILGVELWLPCEKNFLFQAQNPAGTQVFVGSNCGLQSELELFNGEVVRMSRQQQAAVLQHSAGVDAPVMQQAQFAWTVMKSLVDRSVEHRLPMMLDY